MKRYILLKVLIALLLCIATICVFYPGSYNNDTWGQYIHMQKDWADDWFGPGLWYVWKFLISVTGNYKSLFFVFMASYWILLLLLTWDCALFSARFWVVMFLGIFFSFIPQYLMRDTLFAIEWGFAFLLMLRLHKTRNVIGKTLIIVLILVIMMHGLLLRSNAVVALVPFVLALIVAVNNRLSMAKSVICAAALSVVLIISTTKILYGPIEAHRVYPDYKLKLLDVAGITQLSGQNYIPACLTQDTVFDSGYVMAHYTPATFDDIYWAPVNVIPPPTAELNDCVTAAWKKAIREHPALYLKNRSEGFLNYLRIKKRFKNEEYWNVNIEIDPNNPEGLTIQPNKARDAFKTVYDKLSLAYFFDTWLWLVLNIGLFVFTVSRYRKTGAVSLKILACVQLSAILYLLSQFPIYQHDRYFRYNYWNVFVLILTIGAFCKHKPKVAA